MAYNAKILLIEDEELSQITTKKTLENFGCHVAIGSTGAEAIRLFQQNDYDLVIIDICIFDMDGFNIAHKINELQEGKKNKIPMIVLSSRTEESLKRRAKDAEFVEYLAKPLTEETCHRILSGFIHKEIVENSDLLEDNSKF